MTLVAFPKVKVVSCAKKAAAAFQFSVPQLPDRSTVILARGAAGGAVGSGAALLLCSYAPV